MFRVAIASSLLAGTRHAYLCKPPVAVAAAAAPFGTSHATLLKHMPARPKPPPEEEIEEAYLKGSGPGGQKINKTNSAVQLRHKPTGLVVKCQATRSRQQNRKLARELLAEKIDNHLHGDQSRAAKVGEVKKKRADSAKKKSRRKYRNLQEAEEKRAALEIPEASTSQDTRSP